MRNDGYNHANSRGCEKDWIKNSEYLRDEKARYLVGRHGIAYEVTGTITSDNQRIIEFSQSLLELLSIGFSYC